MKHIVMQQGDRWLVGYMLPAQVFAPMFDCPTEEAALREARRCDEIAGELEAIGRRDGELMARKNLQRFLA